MLLFFFFRTVAFHFIYSSIAICYQVCFNCEQLCFDLSGLVVGVELNGLVHFYFRVLIVLTVIHMGSVLMLIPKKACTYCKSVPLCEFVCMHAQNFVYMRAFACFFALMCVVFCRLVAYHDVTAVCMYVPVRGHHTNTMNVDIVKSFIILFFFSKGLLRSCHWKPKNGLMWLCFWVSRQIKYMATINNLLIMGLFWPFWISSQTEIKPAWTI